MKNLKSFRLGGKKVLARCDFNVPVGKNGAILDDFKILQALPTLRYLIKSKAKIILASHLGDPKGKIAEKLRLDKVKKKLEKYLGVKILKTSDCVGKEVEKIVGNMGNGEIVLLENLRFHPEEEKMDLRFSKKLANLADIYINEAFAVCHRKHASLMAAKFLPAFAGFSLEKEVKALTKLRDHPKKPLAVILGGMPKGIKTKIKLIKKMLLKAEFVLLGNLVANELKKRRSDLLCSEKVIVPLDSVDGLDIGPKTLAVFKEKVLKAKTIFWSGPLGRIEEKKYAKGSKAIAKAITMSRALAVAGGGETNLFLKKIGLAKKFSHISTGGDAMLLFLSGEELPGITVIEKR